MRVLVSGMLVGVPRQGGATWAALQWILGLRRLGHDVCFVETLPRSPFVANGTDLRRSPSAELLQNLADRYDLNAALLLEGTRETVGALHEDVFSFANSADLLVNLSGALREEELLEPVGSRLYVDLDPVFTQLWSEAEGVDMGFDAHDRFATVGLTLEDESCPVPGGDRDWMPTLPPVVLDEWPVATERGRAFTTVANWRGYGSVEHDGQAYRQKAHTFRQLIDLPGRTRHELAIALTIHPLEVEDRRALESHGWNLVAPWEAAATPDRYRDFVRASDAELGIAKEGYVKARCGWFSDRSAAYLASGRPVVAQETGFSDVLPVGDGILSFSDVAEAAGRMDEVMTDYAHHAAAARAWAEAHLNADVVLERLLERAFSFQGASA